MVCERTSRPLSVTTTRSSIRTPPTPGHVDARLDRDDVARRPARASPERASRGASWVTSPTPCPSPWPKCSPWPAASMMSRATASISRPSGPGPHRVQGRHLRAQRRARRSRPARPAPIAGRPGPRAVRAVAVEHRADVDRHQRVRRRSPRRAASRAAARRARPRRRSSRTTGPDAPRRRISCSSATATSRSVAPDEPELEQPARRSRRPARRRRRCAGSRPAP